MVSHAFCSTGNDNTETESESTSTSSSLSLNKECPTEMTSCPDGICAISPGECNIVFSCPLGYERCNDGTCRQSKDLCPMTNTCPTTRPYRCEDGSCAFDEMSCLNLSGCMKSKPSKCSNSGLCVNKISECNEYSSQFPNASGCKSAKPLKCLNGKCVKSLTDCKAETNCPEKMVYCTNNGTCAKSMRACARLGTKCPEGQVRCSLDGMCKPTYLDCLNRSLCPVKTPFRCISGECRKYPVSERSVSNKFTNMYEGDHEHCSLGIQCPDYKPYLCADGSCEQKSSFCLTRPACPSNKPFTCFDRSCVTSLDNCKSNYTCPPTNPILCPTSGKCVDNIFSCFDDTCPPSTPYHCGNGHCTKSPRECIVNKFKTSSICDINEATCSDGTCRTEIEHCPVFTGCTKSGESYKCKDGSCVASEKDCGEERTNIECAEGNMLCEDGICRKKCPEYGGCPKGKPLMCPTGDCVEKISECAGLANCPIDTPFRCFDGSCVSEMSNCVQAKRNFVGTNIKMFVNAHRDISSEIIVGEMNEIIGTIKIGANTFYYDAKDAKSSSESEAEKEEEIENNTNTDTNTNGSTEDETKPIKTRLLQKAPTPTPKDDESTDDTKDIIVDDSDAEKAEKEKEQIENDDTKDIDVDDSDAEKAEKEKEQIEDNKDNKDNTPKDDESTDDTKDIDVDDSDTEKAEKEMEEKENEYNNRNNTSTTNDILAQNVEVSIKSIPTSKFRSTSTSYTATRQDDIMKIFPYADAQNKFVLEYQYAVLSSAIQIEINHFNKLKIKNQILLNLAYDFPHKHEELIDNNINKNITTTNSEMKLNPLTDICLGKLNTNTQMWECAKNREMPEEKGNFELLSEVKEEGIYAVILSPKENDTEIKFEQSLFVKYFW
ncbi:MAG: hypothetical protein GY861_06075, partial [bacterium]|nr:hypothetical protein [bacterium]